MKNNFTQKYLKETISILNKIDSKKIDKAVKLILDTKNNKGRIFFLGVGGSAGNASHAVNDFRKILNIECYAPTDNISELTANTNDEGWESSFSGWLKASNLCAKDAVLVFSVGGGSQQHNVSVNLVRSLELALEVRASVFGIVGKDGGYTATVADATVLVPVVNRERVTPHTEGFCAIIWHLLVSHPALKANASKWESIKTL